MVKARQVLTRGANAVTGTGHLLGRITAADLPAVTEKKVVTAAAERVRSAVTHTEIDLILGLMRAGSLRTLPHQPRPLPATNRLHTAAARSLKVARSRSSRRTRRNTTVLLLKDKDSSKPPTKARRIIHSSNAAVDEAVDEAAVTSMDTKEVHHEVTTEVSTEATPEAFLEASTEDIQEDIQEDTPEATTMGSLAPIPMFMIPMRAPPAW